MFTPWQAERAAAWAIVLMLLASPLSWEAYDLVLLVPIASAWIPGDREVPRSLTVVWLGILVGVASAASALGLYPQFTALRPALIVRVVFLAMLAFYSSGPWRRGRGEATSAPLQQRSGGHRPALGGGAGLAGTCWAFE